MLETGDLNNRGKMSDSDDYNESVVMVDPNDIEIPSEPEDDELTIDCDYEINKDGYDPMSLVSVGLEDDDDEEEDDEDRVEDMAEPSEEVCSFCAQTFSSKKELTVHIKTAHPKSCCVACQYCGRVLSDADSYRRHLNNVHQVTRRSWRGLGWVLISYLFAR